MSAHLGILFLLRNRFCNRDWWSAWALFQGIHKGKPNNRHHRCDHNLKENKHRVAAESGIFSEEYASDYYNGNDSNAASVARLGPVKCPPDPITAACRNAVIRDDWSPSDLKIAGCWLSASNLITSVTIKSVSMTRRGAMVLGQLWNRLPLVWVTKCSMKQPLKWMSIRSNSLALRLPMRHRRVSPHS